jgi:hypothetical protein
VCSLSKGHHLAGFQDKPIHSVEGCLPFINTMSTTFQQPVIANAAHTKTVNENVCNMGDSFYSNMMLNDAISYQLCKLI